MNIDISSLDKILWYINCQSNIVGPGCEIKYLNKKYLINVKMLIKKWNVILKNV